MVFGSGASPRAATNDVRQSCWARATSSDTAPSQRFLWVPRAEPRLERYLQAKLRPRLFNHSLPKVRPRSLLMRPQLGSWEASNAIRRLIQWVITVLDN